MIPGITTKLSESVVASATTIRADADVVRVTGTTTIQTILPNNGGYPAFVVLIPVDGTVTLGTSGNISVGIAAAQNRAVFLVFSLVTGKWHINSGV
jgi:hypothetical protein